MRQRTLLDLRQRTPSHAKERAHRACTVYSSVVVMFNRIQEVCVYVSVCEDRGDV